MTCIVGLQQKDKVWIGGDSAGVAGYSITIRADEKVFQNGPFLFGFTSSFRMGQLLRWSFTPPDHDPRVDDFQFMATTFIDAVRQCLKTGGYARTKEGSEEGGCFLVAYNGQLYHIDEDYQVGRSLDTYMAVGCGKDIALGAMYASPKVAPEARIKTALEAAERFNGGVRSPFVILQLDE